MVKKNRNIKLDSNKLLTSAVVATGFISIVALIDTIRLNKNKSNNNSVIISEDKKEPETSKAMSFKDFAASLEDEIKKSSRVFIIGHNNPDLDSIGSAIGIQHLVTSYGKKAYIVVDDDETKIESGTKRIIDENRKKYKIINKNMFKKLMDEEDSPLLIMTDVNKKDMISLGDSLDSFKRIFIIDHHSTNEQTVSTRYMYINEDESSASEIVSKILLTKKIKLTPEVANALLTGISLDTKRFKQNTTPATHDVAEKLIDKGADIEYVNNLFLQDFETHCRIQNLIINGTIIKRLSESLLSPIQASFTFNRNNPLEEHVPEDYAKAADQMLKFAGVDASFVLGYVSPGVIHVSARGNKKVNVGKIMDEIGGGGNAQSAGARIETDDIQKLEDLILEKAMMVIGSDEKVLEEPQVVKVKQLKYSNK